MAPNLDGEEKFIISRGIEWIYELNIKAIKSNKFLKNSPNMEGLVVTWKKKQGGSA